MPVPGDEAVLEGWIEFGGPLKLGNGNIELALACRL